MPGTWLDANLTWPMRIDKGLASYAEWGRKRPVEDGVFEHSSTVIMDLAKPLWTSAASRFFPRSR